MTEETQVQEPVVIEQPAAEEQVKEEAPVVGQTQQEEPKEQLIPRSRLNKVIQQRNEKDNLLKERDSKIAELEEKIKTNATPDINDLVKRQTAAEIAQHEFLRKTGEIYDKGVKDYKKSSFDEAVDALASVEPIGKFPDIVEALYDLGNGQKVIKHLSGDLENYERIIALPPVKRVVEITKLHDKLSAPVKTISDAPAPIKPIGGTTKNTAIDINDKTLPADVRIAEMKRREREAREAKKGDTHM